MEFNKCLNSISLEIPLKFASHLLICNYMCNFANVFVYLYVKLFHCELIIFLYNEFLYESIKAISVKLFAYLY